MRILITTMAAEGHFRPLVPIAHAALRAGHQVVVCAPAAAATLIAEHGLAHLAAGKDWVAAELGAIAADPVLPAGHADHVRHYLTTEGFPGAHALAMARDILSVTASWRPEVIVRENAEFGGYLAAEVLGLPHVAVQAGQASADYLDPRLLAPALNVQRAALGLPSDPAGDRLHACHQVHFTPVGYGPVTDPQVCRYRQANPDRPADHLPDWVADLPTTVPLVLAAFGTIQTRLAAWRPAIEAVVAGLGMLECAAVVAVGAASDLVQSGRVPPNVRVCGHVPQPLLLECCDLFVHHGGFNSVREALRLAVPMVIIPWLNDSGVNAARCEAAGVARVLDLVDLSPVTVREACAEVLNGPAYRAAAKGIQRRIFALPSVDVLITDLEDLVNGSGRARLGRRRSPGMETSTARSVGLEGMRSLTAPATWGQRMMWHWIQWMAPNTEHFNIVLELGVATRTAVDDIVDAVAELTRRHQALRTRFRADGDGGLVQELRSTEELVVETTEVADVADLGKQVATLFKDLRATRFGPAQLPLRTVIAVASGKPVAVLLAMSHVAVDMLSARIVRDELAEMLAARMAGREYPAPRPARQPVEQAVREASARGQRTARRSLEYWRGQFEMAPQALFAVPPAVAPDADRYRRGLLTSRAIGLAADALARRYGGSTSTVLLAATALVLGRYAGAARCTLRLNASNRADPDLRHAVGMLTQDVPVTVELGGPRFADVVSSAWSRSLQAYWRAQYDWAQVEEVWRATGLRRGLNLDLSCFFNDLRDNTAPSATDVAPDAIEAALAETAFAWVESWPRDPRTLLVRITNQGGPVVLDLTVDTSALPLAQARALVDSIEQLLVEAARSDDDLANMAALAGIVPPHRGDEWRDIDGCWIDLAAVRQLLADAVNPVAAEAVVERGPHGEPVLVGYLTPRDPGLTTEAAHAACMALLPGRRTAMAPQRYVLDRRATAPAPAGHDDSRPADSITASP